MKHRTIISAAALLLLAASANGSAAEPTGRMLGVTCAGCHGTDGVSQGPAPSLKGLDRKVTESAMKAFKSGERQGTIMNRIAKGYSDSEIAAMAKYFESLK